MTKFFDLETQERNKYRVKYRMIQVYFEQNINDKIDYAISHSNFVQWNYNLICVFNFEEDISKQQFNRLYDAYDILRANIKFKKTDNILIRLEDKDSNVKYKTYRNLKECITDNIDKIHIQLKTLEQMNDIISSYGISNAKD